VKRTIRGFQWKKKANTRTLFAQLFATHLIAALGGIAIVIAFSRSYLRISAFLYTVVVLAAVLLALALSFVKARALAGALADLTQELDDLASTGQYFTQEFVCRGSAEHRALGQAVTRLVQGLQKRDAELVAEAGLKGQILASMPVGVVLVEASKSVTFMNPSAHALLGSVTLPAGVLDTPYSDFEVYHPRHRDLSSSVVGLGAGRRLVLVQDVTDRKRIDSVRRDFVANASHELKTPVGGILALSETLEQAVDDDPVAAKRFVITLVSQARRLAALVQDLLDLTRLETTKRSTRQTELGPLIRAEIDRITPSAEAKNLSIKGSLQDGVYLSGEPADLRLAVRNLLDNAVRYTLEGEVRIDLRREDSGIVFQVTDTGIGIPRKDLARVFERFYRVDQARSRDTGGTGLGLSIVRHVAERHGGEIRAESGLGNGSRFTMRLPLDPRPASDPGLNSPPVRLT